MKDKYNESDVTIKSPFLSKLDNFWYYHKIHVLVSVFVIIVLSVCIAQCSSREPEDITVLYAGPASFMPEQYAAIRDEIGNAIPIDYDGDGEKRAALITYEVMSEEQIRYYESELETQLNRSYYTEQYQIYSKYITSGECGVFLIDPWLYESLISQEVKILRPLSEVMAEIPEYAVGEYGIKFSETALYKNSEYLSMIPEDTILCLSKPMIMSSGSGNKENYSKMTAMFVSMAQG